MRAIGKEEMPDARRCVHSNASTEFQVQIKKILTEFLASIEEKSKI